MRTVRSSDRLGEMLVHPSMHYAGVCVYPSIRWAGEVSAQGGCSPGGVCPGGVCSGGVWPGGVSPGEGVFPLWTEWQMLGKILSCRNYVVDGKNICHYSKRAPTCHPATFSVRHQDATTVPARHMWETESLNWGQFMLQWFIRFPEFSEFLLHLGKTPLLLLLCRLGACSQRLCNLGCFGMGV